MEKEDLKVLRPFGPTIAKVKIPDNLVKELNDYTDDIINNEQKKKISIGEKFSSNVKQEFIIEKMYGKIGWGKFLASSVREWIRQTNKREITKFNIMNSWIVRQFKNEYNPSHWHNGHVSGVGYLKVPSNLGETLQKDKAINNNGKLEMVHGSKAFLCKPTI